MVRLQGQTQATAAVYRLQQLSTEPPLLENEVVETTLTTKGLKSEGLNVKAAPHSATVIDTKRPLQLRRTPSTASRSVSVKPCSPAMLVTTSELFGKPHNPPAGGTCRLLRIEARQALHHYIAFKLCAPAGLHVLLLAGSQGGGMSENSLVRDCTVLQASPVVSPLRSRIKSSE
jgi:hypothetical protein